MNTGILDTITGVFVNAIQAGAGTLATFSLPLLGVFAIIAFYLHVGPALASGGAGMGDTLAGVLLMLLKIGVFSWLLQHFVAITTAAFQTFLQWGQAAGGGVSLGTFLTPSTVMDVGFRIATPIRDFTDNLVKWAALWKWPTLLTYSLVYYVILLSFAFIAVHLMATIIEFNLAVLVGTVLVPWGVLQPTAFFTEFAIGWITGGLVRVLTTAAMVGIALPLFAQVQPNLTGGGDPTYFGALIAGLTSLVFAILAWIIPARAAAIAGRGVSLAVHGGTIVSGSIVAAQGAVGGYRVARAVATQARDRVEQLMARARAAREEA
jgi:P-type conjugative transfer protein TrbL